MPTFLLTFALLLGLAVADRVPLVEQLEVKSSGHFIKPHSASSLGEKNAVDIGDKEKYRTYRTAVNETSSSGRRIFARGRGMIIATFVADGECSGSRIYAEVEEKLATGRGAGATTQGQINTMCAGDKAWVTAAVYITAVPVKGAVYGVRWYGESADEYKVCGHGNIGMGLLAAKSDMLRPDGTINVMAMYTEDLATITVSETIPHEADTVEVAINFGKAHGFETAPWHDAWEWKASTPEKAQESISWAMSLAGEPQKQIVGVWLGENAAWGVANIKGIFFSHHMVAETGIIVEVGSMEALASIDKDKVQNVKRLGHGCPEGQCPFPDVDGYRGFMVFYLSPDPAISWLCRDFYPQLGVPEDVATGSAAALLTFTMTAYYRGVSVVGGGWFQSYQMSGACCNVLDAAGAFTTMVDTAHDMQIKGKARYIKPYDTTYEYAEDGTTLVSIGCEPSG